MKYLGKIILATLLVGGAAGCNTTQNAQQESAEDLIANCNITTDPINKDGTNDALLGAYYGNWEGKLSQVVVITRINGTEVETYYSNGAYEPWKIYSASCFGIAGTYNEDGTIKLNTFGNGAEVEYKAAGDGIDGTYSRNNRITRGHFKKIDVPIVAK